MTDMMEGMAQSADASSSPVETQAAPTSTPEAAKPEKTYTQRELNNIVYRVKSETAEKYKTRQEQQSQTAADERPNYAPQGGFTESDYRRMASEEAQRLHEKNIETYRQQQVEQDVQNTAKEFYGKMNPGKEKYQDFDHVVGRVDFSKFANSVYMATKGIDNTMDVMYQLAKDPFKLAGLEALSKTDPNLAYSEMQRLSQSIKDNEAASQIKVPNAPLSQLKPSNTGTDNGVMGVTDYRKKYKVQPLLAIVQLI